MAQRKNAGQENLHTLDRVSTTSSSIQIQKRTMETSDSSIKRPTEYVSLFEGDKERLMNDRDYRLDVRRAIFTGINTLLMEVSDYVKEGRAERSQSSCQIYSKLT